jgi:hypothetical protein
MEPQCHFDGPAFGVDVHQMEDESLQHLLVAPVVTKEACEEALIFYVDVLA